MRAMLALVAAVLLALATVACEDSARTGAGEDTEDEASTEQKLSLLFGGDKEAIGAALDQAARYCGEEGEDRDRVADYVTFTIQELEEKKPGHGEDALTIANAIAESAKAAEGGLACSEVAATLLVLMLPR